ncbi:MAG: DUF962 domain-containing protein [Flavobacteriales bacterium]|nr:DUF962 domain-containing protein [Flavobacteriales bacterium]
MSTEKRFGSLAEFYPFYLTEHSNRVCRTFHFIGTTLVMALAITGFATLNWKFFALMPVAGYGFAWIGHFFFEKNKPAAFGNPFYSLASDFIMYWHIVTGQLPKKMEESKKLYPK